MVLDGALGWALVEGRRRLLVFIPTAAVGADLTEDVLLLWATRSRREESLPSKAVIRAARVASGRSSC